MSHARTELKRGRRDSAVAPADRGAAGSVGEVPRLILINGAPASGKSTLARRFAADRVLCLVLDIDDIRAMLGAWADDPERSGLAARRLAVAMARTHLLAGSDVVVPQLLGRVEFIDELQAVAAELGADWYEVVLTASPESLLERLAHRTAHSSRPADADAAALLSRAGGEGAVRSYRDRVNTVARTRPQSIVLDTEAGLEAAHRALVRHLDARA